MSATHRNGTAGTARNGDWHRFFANWMRNPKKMGAVASSSRTYCAQMVRDASVHLDGPVLELGAGLGPVTAALLEAGVAAERITSIEFEPQFASALRERFPGVNVICGDGLDLTQTLAGREGERFAAILLAIPIILFAPERRRQILDGYFRRLAPGGNVTQLSYSQTPPVAPLGDEFTVQRSHIVWANIPPARVWRYTPKPGLHA